MKAAAFVEPHEGAAVPGEAVHSNEFDALLEGLVGSEVQPMYPGAPGGWSVGPRPGPSRTPWVAWPGDLGRCFGQHEGGDCLPVRFAEPQKFRRPPTAGSVPLVVCCRKGGLTSLVGEAVRGEPEDRGVEPGCKSSIYLAPFRRAIWRHTRTLVRGLHWVG